MVEARRINTASVPEHTPLWRDLRGKTGYRVFGALILDELCQGIDLSTAALLRRLRAELHRSLSRQSLTAWRRGDQPVPNEVLLATYAIARRRLSEASLTVAMRVIGDPDADPRFAEKLRLYYRSGRPKLPAERPSWFAGARGDTKRHKTAAPRTAQTALWRDLQGQTRYRAFGALLLDELCQGTDLSMAALLRALRKELHRSLSRQSLAAWRRGDQAVPNEVLIATAGIVHRILAEVSVEIVMRVLSDPGADPRFVEMLRMYHGDGRAGDAI